LSKLSGLNGFAVVDFASRKEVARIVLPEHPGGFGSAEERLGTPSHGIGVAPDGKSLWVNSTIANAVFKYSLPDLQLVGYCSTANPATIESCGHRSGAGMDYVYPRQSTRLRFKLGSAIRICD